MKKAKAEMYAKRPALSLSPKNLQTETPHLPGRGDLFATASANAEARAYRCDELTAIFVAITKHTKQK